MWDEITYPFLNFNGATVEVWNWISNFISHFTEACYYVSMLEWKFIQVSKGPHIVIKQYQTVIKQFHHPSVEIVVATNTILLRTYWSTTLYLKCLSLEKLLRGVIKKLKTEYGHFVNLIRETYCCLFWHTVCFIATKTATYVLGNYAYNLSWQDDTGTRNMPDYIESQGERRAGTAIHICTL